VLALVGEAPGYKEAKDGVPFTGPSGQLLDQVLQHHGLARDQLYIDNACACRPSDNRTPTPDEVKACLPRLLSELGRRPVDTVVTLGNTSSQSIIGTSEGITSLRVGSAKQAVVEGREVRVIPTFHPAACLYAPDNFPSFVKDIGKINGDTTEVTFTPPAYKVFDDPSVAAAALNELMDRFDHFVVDIEVGIEKDVDFDHPERYQFLCIGLGYELGKVAVFGEEALKDVTVRRLMGELILSNKITCQNGKFDLAGLTPITGKIGKLHFDTMLASYAFDERPGTHSLDYLAQEILGAPNWKDEVKPYLGPNGNYAMIPRHILYKYNAYDVHCTWLLKDHYELRFRSEGEEGRDAERLHRFLCDLSVAWIDPEMQGIGIDTEYLEVLTEEYMERIGQLRAELQELVGDRAFNPNSWQQVQRYLQGQGIRVASTDKDHLEELRDKKLHPESEAYQFVILMLQHRRQAKLYGTYVKGTRKRMHKGRVHATFKLHGTVTGRLASTNPNLHNVPRAVEEGKPGENTLRRLFIPAPGFLFVQSDYATVELRVMAVEGDDPFLTTIFVEDRDIHDEFSLVFYGEEFTKEQRVRTKAFVYGTAYGREAKSVAKEYDIPVSEAVANQQALRNAMPGVTEWQEGIKKALKDDGEIVTRFGRRRRYPLLTSANWYDAVKEALAFSAQSPASDITQTAFMRARQEGLNAILTVHDSILLEEREDEAEEKAVLLNEIMSTTATELMGPKVPFPVDAKIGRNWAEV
jgi:uracil-DNA glycosylase family 4